MNFLQCFRLKILFLAALAGASAPPSLAQEAQTLPVPQRSAATQAQQVDAAGEPLQRLPPLKLPASVVEEKDIVFARYGTREMKLNLFRPATGDGPFPAVVFVMAVHGSWGTAVALVTRPAIWPAKDTSA